jgi:hypothetical protein
MTDRELLAAGGGLALGFLVVWFLTGSRKAPASSRAAPPPSGGDVIEGAILSEKPDVMEVIARSWRSTLGVGMDATRAQVDAAYQELCRQYDPGKLESMAPELRTIARTRREQIDEAYREALAELGAADR